jgi:hypothetical protein
MDAAADYAAAKAMMTRPLPAYVSFAVRSHVKFDAIVRDETSQVVVRTQDGVVVKGKVPESPPNGIQIGDERDSGMEPVKHPAFKADCYEATGARMQAYHGAEREAIALRTVCSRKKGDQDFDTLYVDSFTHEPIAAVGADDDGHVAVQLVQQFTRVQDHALPSSLYVRIHGSGLMFWLDLLVDQHYEDYRFSAVP